MANICDSEKLVIRLIEMVRMSTDLTLTNFNVF